MQIPHGNRLFGIVLGLVLVLAPSIGWAQAEEVIPPHTAAAPTADDDSKFRDMKATGQMANRAVMEKVIRHQMSLLTKPENAAEYGETRARLRRDYFMATGRAASNILHDAMVELTLEVSEQIVAGNYTPYSKAAAVLVAAELNKTEVGLTAADPPPVPYQPALDFLLNVAADAKQPEGVRAAALYGVDRHASLGIRVTQDQARAQSVLLPLAQAGPENKPNHSWIRHRAIRALGRLGQAGENGEVAKALYAIVTDTKESPMLRAEAFRALGFIDQTAKPAAPPAQQAAQGLRLILAAADAQGRQSWTVRKIRVLQQVLGYVEWGMLGPRQDQGNVLKMFDPQVEGPVLTLYPNGGLLAAANSAGQDTIAGMNRQLDGLRNLIFDVENVDVNQLIAQIEDIEAYLLQVEPTLKPAAGE
jgi:hypothetical protein